jgi:hypothetical protein
MSAAIWCKEHVPTKTIVHRMNDIVDETGLNALQLYVQNFKQADLTLTGTVRKATLVNQSTKVVNTTSVTQTPNRRTSMASANGHSIPARGSVSHPKVEETSDASSSTGATAEKVCATCRIDVSPKWWSFPPIAANDATTNGDIRTNGDHTISNGLQLNEGQAPTESLADDGGSHAALAAAALHQNTQVAPPEPTEFQCHQCHWKKVQKEPSPPPAVIQRETSRPPISAPIATINAPIPDADAVQERPHYSWPAPPSYPSNGSYSTWSRHSPASQGATLVNQLNGNHSPVATPAAVQPLNGQTHVGQSSYNRPQSPHQNGHIGQVPNGYPPSPHRSMGSSTVHMQNGTYVSYASTRPTPQHLTNGVSPPPRAPEHPFSNAPMRPRSSIGPPQGSSPMHREAHPQARELPQPNNPRQNDGRVNGGASASPSLQNLLS